MLDSSSSRHDMPAIITWKELIFVVATCATQTLAAWKCPFAQPVTGDPSVPTLPNTYTVKVEANIRRDGAMAGTYTTIADEVYDYYGNRASVVMKREGEMFKTLYSYDTGELFYISDGECRVGQINGSSSVENAFFGVDTRDGRQHVFAPNRAIQYGLQFNQTYVGRDVVRGIEVNHWQSCGYLAEKGANFTLDWYYAAPNWSTSNGADLPRVPVRAMVSGQADPGGDFHTFNHTYEFVDFVGSYDDDTVFETPAGIVCPGRKKTKPIPKLNDAYSYNEEVVVSLQQAVVNAKVMYDSSMKLLRFDWRPTKIEAPYYTTHPQTAIHDYDIGVSYVRDNLLLNCSITSLRNDTFDEVKYNTGQGYAIRMRTPDELLQLDDSYTYEGTRYLRDMGTDVFVTKKPYRPLGFKEAFDATFEVHFLSSDWDEVSSGIAEETQVPLRIIIWSESPAYKMIYNIFNFDNDNPDTRAFDVSDCYSDGMKRRFIITYRAFSNFGDLNKRLFAASAQTSIKTLAGVNNLRIQFPKVTLGGDEVYVASTLLDKPPATALFRPQENAPRRAKDKLLTSVNSMAECAERCRDEGSFSCNSFDYCPLSLKCYLDKTHSGDEVEPNDDFSACIHYSRTVDYQFNPEPTLASAWRFLKNGVYSGFANVDMPSGDGDVLSFKATSIRETSFKSIDEYLPGSYLEEFKFFKKQVVLLKNDKVIPDLSVDECARACSTEVDFDCNSFDYCNNVGECLLSHFHPSDDVSVVTKHDNCDLYARLYVLQFQLYPGTSVVTKQHYLASGITNEEDCAKACLQHKDFTCRSFDFCRLSRTCLLGKDHVLDVPAKNVKSKPSCNHYSRKYTADFNVISQNTTLPSVNKMVVVGSYPEDCAKLCVRDMGEGCSGFGFCAEDNACILDSQRIRNLEVGQVDTKTVYKTCDFYNRTAYQYVAPHTEQVKSANSYNSSDMIGLGFGVCIGGLVLGMLAMLAICRLRSGNKSEIFQMDNINYQHENQS